MHGKRFLKICQLIDGSHFTDTITREVCDNYIILNKYDSNVHPNWSSNLVKDKQYDA